MTWLEILPSFAAPSLIVGAMFCDKVLNNMFIMLWVTFVILPLLDYIIPISHFNIPKERVRLLEKDTRFLIPLYTVWVLDLFLLFTLLNDVSSGRIGNTSSSFFYYAICGALPGALNAVVGHELLHRRNIIHKITGTLAYAKMIYGHYYVHHIKNHHKDVATPKDAVTARMGESVFSFYWRAIP